MKKAAQEHEIVRPTSSLAAARSCNWLDGDVMVRRADQSLSGELVFPAADICIIGAGVAGIAVARRLSGSGLRILLLESGDREHAAFAQELNAGVTNDPNYPFEGSRSRGFGGTSRLWYGACIRLDPFDFEHRDWFPHSGWPLSASDLGPFYDVTRELFGVGDLDAAAADLQATDFHGGGLEAKVVAHSDPVDLGKKYWDDLDRHPDVICRLNATVTCLHSSQNGDRVTHLVARGPDGTRMHITADEVILACGGIENARLLLASNVESPAGIGNRHDVVGRYHMEHPMRAVGVLPLGHNASNLVGFTDRGHARQADVVGTLGLSREVREQHRLLDLHLRVFRFHPAEATPQVIAGKDAARHLRGPERWTQAARMLRAAVAPGVPRYLLWHAAGKLSARTPFDHVRFTAFLEQEPDPENRITLSDRKDRFGQSLPHLAWRESEFMSDSCRRSLELLKISFQNNGFGRFQYEKEETAYLSMYDQYGLHHMGSTRMHTDPRLGVVDSDCKVHGVSNLYIAGSSVFPTGGAANPTWTIAALAHRLAEHIIAKRRPRERGLGDAQKERITL